MKDLRTIDHWVAKLETNESRNMPPGGYPLAGFEDATLASFHGNAGRESTACRHGG